MATAPPLVWILVTMGISLMIGLFIGVQIGRSDRRPVQPFELMPITEVHVRVLADVYAAYLRAEVLGTHWHTWQIDPARIGANQRLVVHEMEIIAGTAVDTGQRFERMVAAVTAVTDTARPAVRVRYTPPDAAGRSCG